MSLSDTDHAASLLDAIVAPRGVREPVKCMLERAYAQLIKINPKWTRRRVRAVWEMKAARIDHREIVEMEAVVEARKRHAAYREETATLVAMALAREANNAGRTSSGQGGGLG